ncbi:MAG: LptF/LptG family permease [Bacteroidales bacterium]|nr:LptF/LptG family permease [Bacteroidales bacterium]
MKKIYWLVIKSYLGPLVMTFFIALFILLMQFLWKYIDDLVGKGLEWYIIAELLFYASSTFVPLALPLAILLSSLMTFGNLGENYELVAMKAAGISLRRIMMPLIVLSVIISVVAFYFSNNILPVANLKFKSLLYDVREQKLALDIKEGIFYDGIEDYIIRVGKKENDEKTVRDVMIYDHRDNKGNINVTVADSGKMELTPDGHYLVFFLFNGTNYVELVDQRNYKRDLPQRTSHFRENFKKFSLMDFEMSRTNEDLFRSNYSMLNLNQLEVAEDSLIEQYKERRSEIAPSLIRSMYYYTRIDSAKNAKYLAEKDSTTMNDTTGMLAGFNKNEKMEILEEAAQKCRRQRETIGFYTDELQRKRELIHKHQAEWHRKFTLSFACFVLFFIGAPLGAIIRRGGLGLPVVVSVLFFVLFHVISITGEKSVKEGAIDANYGMWIASAVLLPLGIFLTIKATTDSPLLDADAWKKLFRKIFKNKGGK